MRGLVIDRCGPLLREGRVSEHECSQRRREKFHCGSILQTACEPRKRLILPRGNLSMETGGRHSMMKVLVTLVLSVTLSTAAYGQGTIKKREQIQRERIQQGVNSGELTRPEAQRLRVEQARVHATEARAKKDGVVTPRERAKL